MEVIIYKSEPPKEVLYKNTTFSGENMRVNINVYKDQDGSYEQQCIIPEIFSIIIHNATHSYPEERKIGSMYEISSNLKGFEKEYNDFKQRQIDCAIEAAIEEKKSIENSINIENPEFIRYIDYQQSILSYDAIVTPINSINRVYLYGTNGAISNILVQQAIQFNSIDEILYQQINKDRYIESVISNLTIKRNKAVFDFVLSKLRWYRPLFTLGQTTSFQKYTNHDITKAVKIFISRAGLSGKLSNGQIPMVFLPVIQDISKSHIENMQSEYKSTTNDVKQCKTILTSKVMATYINQSGNDNKDYPTQYEVYNTESQLLSGRTTQCLLVKLSDIQLINGSWHITLRSYANTVPSNNLSGRDILPSSISLSNTVLIFGNIYRYNNKIERPQNTSYTNAYKDVTASPNELFAINIPENDNLIPVYCDINNNYEYFTVVIPESDNPMQKVFTLDGDTMQLPLNIVLENNDQSKYYTNRLSPNIQSSIKSLSDIITLCSVVTTPQNLDKFMIRYITNFTSSNGAYLYDYYYVLHTVVHYYDKLCGIYNIFTTSYDEKFSDQITRKMLYINDMNIMETSITEKKNNIETENITYSSASVAGNIRFDNIRVSIYTQETIDAIEV